MVRGPVLQLQHGTSRLVPNFQMQMRIKILKAGVLFQEAPAQEERLSLVKCVK